MAGKGKGGFAYQPRRADPPDRARGAAPAAPLGFAPWRRTRAPRPLVAVAAPAPSGRSSRSSGAPGASPAAGTTRSRDARADPHRRRARHRRAERDRLVADRGAPSARHPAPGPSQWGPATPTGGHARGDAQREPLAHSSTRL